MFTSASFLLTERCNLACKYCFESKNRKCKPDMSKEIAEKGLSFLFRNAAMCQKDRVDVMLFGGEPLLAPDVCEHLLKTGEALQQKTGIGFSANLITNGTVMDDKTELMLHRFAARLPGFTCQLSVDGAQESHNLYRVFPDGSGSFAAAAKNAAAFREIFGGRLNVHGCINKETLPHLYENYRFLADEWRPGNLWFMPVHTENWGMEDVEEYDVQLGLIFRDLKRRCTMSYFSPLHKLLSCKPGRERQPDKFCGAGNSFCAITGDGALYPCHNIYFNDPSDSTLCGNVWEGVTKPDVLKPFEEYNVATLGCAGCENTQCYRCIADNWVHGGDVTAQVGKPIRCLMSGVETKYQRLAREYADKNLRGGEKKEGNSILADRVEEVQSNLTRLGAILYQGLGGENHGA